MGVGFFSIHVVKILTPEIDYIKSARFSHIIFIPSSVLEKNPTPKLTRMVIRDVPSREGLVLIYSL